MHCPLAYSAGAGDCDQTGVTTTWHSQHTIGDIRSACPALCARSAQSRAHTLPLPTPQTLRPPSFLQDGFLLRQDFHLQYVRRFRHRTSSLMPAGSARKSVRARAHHRAAA